MKRIAAVGEWLTALALVAWVGGHAALGAFAARIVFRELPRSLAAHTMTLVFRSFDKLILVGVLLVLVGAGLRAAGRRLAGRADRIALGLAVALAALGIFELAWVHPQIEAMFEAGRTLEPSFQQLHRLSARCANLEVLLAAVLLLVQSWSREA